MSRRAQSYGIDLLLLLMLLVVVAVCAMCPMHRLDEILISDFRHGSIPVYQKPVYTVNRKQHCVI